MDEQARSFHKFSGLFLLGWVKLLYDLPPNKAPPWL